MYVSSLRAQMSLPPQLFLPLTPSNDAIALALAGTPDLAAAAHPQPSRQFPAPDPVALAANSVDVYA